MNQKPLHVRAMEAYQQEIERLPDCAHLPFADWLMEFIDAETGEWPTQACDLPETTHPAYRVGHDSGIPF